MAAGRPKSFDTNTALDAAVALFKDKGYAQTSMQDLVDAMGIHRGSIYDTFGGKKELFLAALDRYIGGMMAEALAVLDTQDSAMDALQQYFAAVYRMTRRYASQQGCLVTNTAVEMAPHDAAMLERVTRYFLNQEDSFRRLLEKAQADGELDASEDARAWARAMVNFGLGLTVLVKVTPSEEWIEDIFAAGLSFLRSPSGRPVPLTGMHRVNS